MKSLFKAAGLAALMLALPAAAQDQNERFRYLGVETNFAVMGSEASGPRDARRIAGVVVNRDASGPGGIDGAHITIIANCAANTTQMIWAAAYLGDEKIFESDQPGARAEPTAGPHRLLFDYACSGKAPAGEAIWADGIEDARAYARKQIKVD